MMGACTIHIELRKDELPVVVARKTNLVSGVNRGENQTSKDLRYALLRFFSQEGHKGKILTNESVWAARRSMEEAVFQD